MERELGKFGVTHTLGVSEGHYLDFASEFISITFATRVISQMSFDPVPEELVSYSLKEKGS